MVFQASAATNEVINFEDYLTIIDFSEEYFKVLIRFDPSDFDVRWNLYSSSWEEIDTIKSPSGQLEVPEGSSYTNMILKYYPMGYYSYVNLAYIPDGTVVDISFQGGITDPDYFTSNDGSIRTGLSMKFYDENFVQVGSTVYHYIDSTTLEYINGSFTMDKPDGAVYVRIDSIFRDFESNYTAFPVSAGSFTMKFSLPVSIIDQIEDDEASEKLDKILEELMASSDGASGDLVDQVGDQSGQLGDMTDMMDGVDRPNVGDIDISIDQYITEDMMTSSTPLLSIILELPIVMNMLMLMLCMAFVGYVLFGKRG